MQGVVKFERGNGFVELRDTAQDAPGPHQVKVEVKASGICGSDLHVYRDTINYNIKTCLLYTSPSPRDKRQSRMPSSA